MKMKINPLIPTVMLALMITCCQAQEDQPSTFLKHDIGFNTNFILENLFQSAETPFSFMYKRYSAPNKALRLGFDASYYNSESKDKTSQLGNGYQDMNNLFLAISIGKEWQNTVSKRWMFYCGGDIEQAYRTTNTDSYTNDDKTTTHQNSFLRTSVKPLLGIRFNILERLYLSAEANATLAFTSSKTKRTDWNPEQVREDFKTNSISFDFRPATGVFLFYKF